MRNFRKRWLVVVVVCMAGFFALRPANLAAAVVPALTVTESETVLAALNNPQIVARLAALGYSRTEVENALSTLSPTQRAELNQRLSQMTQAGNDFGVFVVIVAVIALVAIILHATGHSLTIETKAGN